MDKNESSKNCDDLIAEFWEIVRSNPSKYVFGVMMDAALLIVERLIDEVENRQSRESADAMRQQIIAYLLRDDSDRYETTKH